MSKHTPGPWRLVVRGDDCAVVGADGSTVCDNETYYPAPVSLEDATLIAATIDLLDACLQVREFLLSIAYNVSDMDVLDAAIQKARGELCLNQK